MSQSLYERCLSTCNRRGVHKDPGRVQFYIRPQVDACLCCCHVKGCAKLVDFPCMLSNVYVVLDAHVGIGHCNPRPVGAGRQGDHESRIQWHSFYLALDS